MKFADFVNAGIKKSQKTQKQISQELGFRTSNLITMIKQGTIKCPLYIVPKLADSIGVDRKKMFNLALKEYNPDTHAAIVEVYGDAITPIERKLLDRLASVADYSHIETDEQLDAYWGDLV